jgi:hypothetical protein
MKINYLALITEIILPYMEPPCRVSRGKTGEGDTGKTDYRNLGVAQNVAAVVLPHLDKKIPQSVIARLLNVNRLTVRHYIRTRKLQKPAVEKL